MLKRMNKMLIVKESELKVNEDKKISTAVMSSFVILMGQYFILYFFNIESTKMGENIQLISKAIVGLFFLRVFPTVFKKQGTLFILMYCVFLAIFSFNYLFFQQNIVYLNDVLFKFFFICLPCFLYSFSINDRRILRDIMEKCGLIVFIIGLIIGFLVFIKKISLGSYSMSLSYYMLLPTLIFMDKFFEKFSIKSIIFSIVSLFVMLALGSRGAIMCVGVYVILYLLINSRGINAKKFLINIVIFVLIIFILIYLKEIFIFMNRILNKFGIYSRSINLFLKNEINLSGRDVIYDEVLYQIESNPILGIGLGGDRLYTGGSYSHNIILEIVSGFGVVFGTIILIIIGIISTKSLFSKDIEESNLMLIWFCIGFVPLMVSGSYLIDFQLWIYLGLAVRFLKELKGKKKIGYKGR
ncbi:hypothetical protein EQM13_10580 [Acidilutibacter cellobiosedens]|uniref:O-antigen ligase-related domain-containing protein n=2 Tax=Acidilutibacter cellobiosedens TaxID=2507161 RepID=A0A410QDD2_9FIRM|nr:hypothetical protein EQM13_10580 [Acidilutibacter cellobiosedens]